MRPRVILWLVFLFVSSIWYALDPAARDQAQASRPASAAVVATTRLS